MISVLVVDDSIVVRRLISDALGTAPDIEVVGTAANGRLALQRVTQLAPAVITMDIEMPEMNGIEAVRELRRTGVRTPIIMFSTLTASGASATLDALAAGATDYVTKPANTGSVHASIAAVRDQLVPRIRALGGRPARPAAAPSRPVDGRPVRPPGPQVDGRRAPAGAPRPARPAAPAAPRPGIGSGRIDVLAIGSSTGGPDALALVLGALPATLAVPVVIVQHMPPLFTTMFAERLNRTLKLTVHEAAHDVPLVAGHVYIAPGDRHLEVARQGVGVRTRLTDAPAENSCRPAVDVLFRSVAAVYGRATVATVLTGMGQDGRAGAEILRRAGAEIVAQDEASSVVWGMPGAVVEAGLADQVKPLAAIGGYLAGRAGAARPLTGLAVGP
ncbi:chemotaxis response regulator protein-glutamate methylesterase [Pilimelia terevasa]|uniref:Protein-glutamate methylesterase/protein-glutamine glutaminase n=1 Tax=Pilimelia terevasa TaxID=53372 RepID=A0A8J3FEQ4_9ACTN|nr:chemotaxis response regulator protein-glutamate methylesterase [Pilimelia terevasa]GGK17954.1 chemotaxis response regulator protein-glutamate methylesterase [Pilimelia terevasa]